MSWLFDIDGAQIAQLSDGDLRSLVARLCEAELARAGFSTSFVTAGGNQDAADGGLDVRVALPRDAKIEGFVPRPSTGFQVKASDMPRGEILDEMRPSGRVRSVIEELAREGGAYVTVSGQGSTADKPLRDRRKAMREAVEDLAGSESLATRFYDRDQVARWVRTHPGLIAWVRERIGQPLAGWRSVDDWSGSAEGPDAKYLLDGTARLSDLGSRGEGSLPIGAGLDRIRDILAEPRGVVRLVGLSGTGKTRLAQAIFDPSVGGKALDPALARYADTGDEPQPPPREVARRLATTGERTILIVDNCLPETHRALTLACAGPESRVSLLTIEYDVGDDEPEATDVFRLGPVSDEVIEQLLERRAPHLGAIDRRRVAALSSGNARLALLLAPAVRRGESVAHLNDRLLFERLFHQRHQPDRELLRAAETLSLVYSFDGETLEGEEAELPFLSRLAGFELYPHIADLSDRELIQSRKRWRAVLPHALANRLARRALERLPREHLVDKMIHEAPGRLLRSFSHRLGFLHDCEPAQRIVEGWLAPGGLLADVGQLSPLGLSLLRSVAPVAPRAALEARTCASGRPGFGAGGHGEPRAADVGSAAQEPGVRRRPVRTGLRVDRGVRRRRAGGPPLRFGGGAVRRAVPPSPLRHARARGATARGGPPASRQRERPGAGGRPVGAERAVGGLALLFELRLRVRRPGQGFRVATGDRRGGGRVVPRRPGTRGRTGPRRGAPAQPSAVGPGEPIPAAVGDCGRGGGIGPPRPGHSRGRVLVGGVEGRPRDDPARRREHAARGRGEAAGPGAGAPAKDAARSGTGVHLRQGMGYLGLDDGQDDGDDGPDGSRDGLVRQVELLGREVAAQPRLLASLLPDLLTAEAGQGLAFGRGLAAGSSDLVADWRVLVSALEGVAEEDRNLDALRGFLNGAHERDVGAAAWLLNEAVHDPVLGRHFPVLQTAVDIDGRGAERLLASIACGLAPSRAYEWLSRGRAVDPIEPGTFCRIVRGIASLEAGYEPAVAVLFDRLWRERNEGDIDPELLKAGQELVGSCTFGRPGPMLDLHLGKIVEVCFVGPEAAQGAAAVCTSFADALARGNANVHDYSRLVEALLKAQPTIALDAFLASPAGGRGFMSLRDVALGFRHPLDAVPEDALFAWAESDPAERLAKLASVAPLFAKSQGESTATLRPIARELLDRAADKAVILTIFARRLVPTSWAGNLADVLDTRRVALRSLVSHADPLVADWTRAQDERLARAIEAERRREQGMDESFE